ncbi:MAG: DUF1566 domain-containing protein [Candidatus Aureabacteria bacterium]|nr:DUF1566 domain-containing protein [Candidatus Auribacterota bacterium]
MKKLITFVSGLLFTVCLADLAIAGSIDSPGATSAGSGMYTLQSLYNYIVSGTALDATTSFQEPSAGPGSTMKTIKEIGDALKAMLDQCSVTTADSVELGKPFFSTQPGSWGVQTGTLSALPRPTATPTVTATATETATPTSTPTPTKTWYEQYGPWPGAGDVVPIGSMYVASRKEGDGCANDNTKAWASALSWVNNLVWLEKDDWRLPTKEELSTICSNRGSLESYQSGSYYWSSSGYGGDGLWCVLFNSDCWINGQNSPNSWFVRAVR